MSTSACFISSIDCFLMKLVELAVLPVLAHLRVEEVLVDRRQFFLERTIQRIYYIFVTLHVPELYLTNALNAPT